MANWVNTRRLMRFSNAYALVGKAERRCFRHVGVTRSKVCELSMRITASLTRIRNETQAPRMVAAASLPSRIRTITRRSHSPILHNSLAGLCHEKVPTCIVMVTGCSLRGFRVWLHNLWLQDCSAKAQRVNMARCCHVEYLPTTGRNRVASLFEGFS